MALVPLSFEAERDELLVQSENVSQVKILEKALGLNPVKCNNRIDRLMRLLYSANLFT